MIDKVKALRNIAAEGSPELTSLLREALEVLKWYADRSHVKRLSGRIDWDAERAKLSRDGFDFSFESYEGAEFYVEDGSRARLLADKMEDALESVGDINNSPSASSIEVELWMQNNHGDSK